MQEPAGPNVYVGPGIEAGAIVLPAVVVAPIVAEILLAPSETSAWPWPVAIVAGVISWLGAWEFFSRVHPRFSTGYGETLEWLVAVCGPPVVAVIVMVLSLLWIRSQ